MNTSSTPPTSREALLARIRASSRSAVTLEEMQRLGFWPADDQSLSVEAELIRRETELEQALQALGRELRDVEDPVQALKRMRKERMAQAKIRREEARQRRARERHERALAWHARRAKELLYLGAGVSAGLNEARSDADRLARLALPPMHDAQDLAAAMGLSLHELRFLAFDRRVSRICHYRRFAMPKKTGGERIISAPMPRLKRAQYWVLDNVLARAPVHPAAHGFLRGRSIVSNAAPHVGQAVVVNVDLKDFFPSIDMARVRGVFRELGYGRQVATTLALLCTAAVTEQVSVDGETFHVATGARVLPQGAPTSPALTNILCRRLDARLQGAAAKLGFRYTRYADDLTFSGDAAARKLAGKLLWRVRRIVVAEGFTPHPDKQHVMCASERQRVTGIVVNDKLTVDRDTLRRFRATLFQVEKDGPAGKQWNGNENVLAALEGYALFVRMVDAAKGAPLLARVRAARAKWSGQEAPGPAGVAGRRGQAFRQLSTQGEAPWEGFWQAGATPLPVLEKTQEQVRLEKTAARAPTREDAAAHVEARAAVAEPVPVPALKKRSVGPALVVQVIVMSLLARGFQNMLPILCGLALFSFSLRDGQPHWKRFGIVMAIVALLLALT
ncbi:reverse transcriptase family protein [uncultured Massilia sp.]|uniref:reverse transcriptase family protein n=1 Tax=uncultured Massilia sp. TaxID=169973 RepID=UPI0025E28E05|nr:reverse transcriptase family protein [uncultured Massilia sp.]